MESAFLKGETLKLPRGSDYTFNFVPPRKGHRHSRIPPPGPALGPTSLGPPLGPTFSRAKGGPKSREQSQGLARPKGCPPAPGFSFFEREARERVLGPTERGQSQDFRGRARESTSLGSAGGQPSGPRSGLFNKKALARLHLSGPFWATKPGQVGPTPPLVLPPVGPTVPLPAFWFFEQKRRERGLGPTRPPEVRAKTSGVEPRVFGVGPARRAKGGGGEEGFVFFVIFPFF